MPKMKRKIKTKTKSEKKQKLTPTTKKSKPQRKRSSTNSVKKITNDIGSETNITEDLEEITVAKRYKIGNEDTNSTSNAPSPTDQLSSSLELPSCSYKPVKDGDSNTRLSHDEFHRASGLKYNLHGTVYQWKLLALFLYRATAAYECFSLATEMDEAEKFDDVVLKYKISEKNLKWTSRFLQAKHKIDGSTIKESDLFGASSKTSGKKPYLLSKYYLSFRKIKRNKFFADSDLKDFIICTNTELDESVDKYFTDVTEYFSKNEKILSFELSTFKVFKLSDVAIKKFNSFKNNVELVEFFEKFRLITNFSNVNDLNELILKDLGVKYELNNAELAANTFKHHIMEWFKSYENKQSRYLFIEDGKRFHENINNQINALMAVGLAIEYAEKLMSYNIHFGDVPDDVKEFLIQDKTQILHLNSESALLSSIKAVDIIKNMNTFNRKDSFIYVPLEKLLINNLQTIICNAFSSSTSHNLLIINLETSETNNFVKLYLELHAILSKHLFKKIITIGHSKNIHSQLMKELDKCQTRNDKFQEKNDSNSYKDLDDTTQEIILQKEVIFQEKHLPFKQIINTYSAQTIFNEVFLTEFVKNTDIHIGTNRIESRESKVLSSYVTRTLSSLRDFSRNAPRENINYINECDLFQSKGSSKKLYIVTGEPGIGKSAFTVNLQQKLKQINPLYWVVRINLYEYSNRDNGRKSLEDIGFSELDIINAINFMAEIVIPGESSNTYVSFQRNLFILGLQNCNDKYKYPKIVLIFDGFDEITPAYEKTTLVLLKALEKTNVFQLWITTRTHEAQTLKCELKWPTLILNYFTSDQIMKYITNVLEKCNKPCHNNETILNSICTYLNEMNKFSSDFVNNPLHLSMIIEIIAENKAFLGTNFTLYQLYSEFVKIKFDIFYNKKRLKDNSVANIEICTRDRTTLGKIHQHLALKEVFPKLSKEEIAEMNANELVRAGFLIISGSRIRFVHRSYAEFFFSNYLDENFKNLEVRNILTDIYFYDFHLSVVRKLLNNSDNFLKQLKETDHNILKILYERNLHELAICNLIEDNNDNILRNLLFNVKANNINLLETVLNNCFQHKETLTGTKGKMASLIQLALLNTGSLFDLLFEDIIKPKTSKEFFIRDQSCFYIWAIYYSGTNRIPVLNDIFVAAFKNEQLRNKNESFQDLISKVLYKKYYREASILHEMASEMRIDFIQDLILWLQDNNKNIIVDLLFMMDSGENSFLRVLNCDDSLTSFLSFLFTTLGECRFKRLISHTTANDKTIFHHYMMKTITGYEAMNSYLTFLAENCTKEFIAEVIYKVDNLGCTAFHYGFEHPDDYKQFRLLVQFAISRFEPNTYSSSSQALHNANEDIALKDLVDSCKTTFNRNFFECFSRVDKWGQTILHNMVERLVSNTNKVFDGFLDFLFNYFGLENVRELFLFKTDVISQQTVFHIASRRHNGTLKSLLDYTKEKFDLETVKTLVLQSDKNGQTCLHNAAQSNSNHPMQIILSFAASNFSKDVLNEMLLAQNQQKQNALHLAVNNYFVSVSDPLIPLLEFYRKFCDQRVVFGKLFLQKDDYNKTFLDILKYRMNRYLLELREIYELFIETLDINNPTYSGVHDINILTESESTLLREHIEYLFSGFLTKKRQDYLLKLDEYITQFPVSGNDSQ